MGIDAAEADLITVLGGALGETVRGCKSLLADAAAAQERRHRELEARVVAFGQEQDQRDAAAREAFAGLQKSLEGRLAGLRDELGVDARLDALAQALDAARAASAEAAATLTQALGAAGADSAAALARHGQSLEAAEARLRAELAAQAARQDAALRELEARQEAKLAAGLESLRAALAAEFDAGRWVAQLAEALRGLPAPVVQAVNEIKLPEQPAAPVTVRFDLPLREAVKEIEYTPTGWPTRIRERESYLEPGRGE